MIVCEHEFYWAFLHYIHSWLKQWAMFVRSKYCRTQLWEVSLTYRGWPLVYRCTNLWFIEYSLLSAVWSTRLRLRKWGVIWILKVRPLIMTLDREMIYSGLKWGLIMVVRGSVFQVSEPTMVCRKLWWSKGTFKILRDQRVRTSVPWLTYLEMLTTEL